MAKTVLSKVKLFDSELGKILVRVETDKTGNPKVVIYFWQEGIGTRSLSAPFDKGRFNAANKYFDYLDKEKTIEKIKLSI